MINTALVRSQRAAVLKHLIRHGSIEHNQARELYGCAALRSRIAELRRAGHPIGDQWVRFTSMYGHKGACKRYIFTHQEPDGPDPADVLLDELYAAQPTPYDP